MNWSVYKLERSDATHLGIPLWKLVRVLPPRIIEEAIIALRTFTETFPEERAVILRDRGMFYGETDEKK